jgi:hypothetical protein
MKTTGVDDPPANPMSLGDAWTGQTKPVFVVSEKEAMTQTIDELRRLRAMRDALIALRNDHYWVSRMNPELQTIHRGLDRVIALASPADAQRETPAPPAETTP